MFNKDMIKKKNNTLRNRTANKIKEKHLFIHIIIGNVIKTIYIHFGLFSQ